MRRYIFILLGLFLLSCKNPSGNEESRKEYFDLKSIIREQSTLMSSIRPTLTKRAIINGKEEIQRFVPDSSQWLDELRIFNSADINIPVLQGMYSVVAGKQEPDNNLRVFQYIPQNAEEADVKFLKVFFVKDTLDYRKIEALVVERNPLFTGKRNFVLEFEDHGQYRLYLKNYKIEGSQKMIMMDSVHFLIEGTIDL